MAGPFTQEEFIEVFTKYNTETWPMVIAFYILALVAVYFLFKKSQNSDSIISGTFTFFLVLDGFSISYPLFYGYK